MFDAEKLKEKADQARAQEKIRRESFKRDKTKDKEWAIEQVVCAMQLLFF